MINTKYIKYVLILTLVFCGLILPDDLPAFSAKVIGIMDGDTIEVLKDRKPVRIRLYGIDSPEHDQDFGSKARRFTSEKVFLILSLICFDVSALSNF